MLRRPVKEIYINDVWQSIPYKNQDDRIAKTGELVANKKRMGIRNIEDDEKGNIIYSHRMEEGAFN